MGWTDWTRCLHMRKRLLANAQQLQSHLVGFVLYFGSSGSLIGVRAQIFQARLNAFRQAGRSRSRPLYISRLSSLR
jgi:hypothetical protein